MTLDVDRARAEAALRPELQRLPDAAKALKAKAKAMSFPGTAVVIYLIARFDVCYE
jgi:hypothetical protein